MDVLSVIKIHADFFLSHRKGVSRILRHVDFAFMQVTDSIAVTKVKILQTV